MNLISQAKTWLSVKNTSWETVLYTFMSSLKDTHCLAGLLVKSRNLEVVGVVKEFLDEEGLSDTPSTVHNDELRLL